MKTRRLGYGVGLGPIRFIGTTAVLACLWVASGWAAPPEGARSPVLLIGDSMMRLPGIAMERELSRLPGVQATTFADLGTGLARLDAFDWLAKIDELCAAHHPKIAVVALGANDRQPMQLSDLHGLAQPGTPAWDEEYAQRVGQAMDRLHAGGCETVIWLLLPSMRDPSMDAFAKQVNTIALAQAQARSWVVPHDFNRLMADRRTGGYTERVMNPQTAQSISVRDKDGIHLTPEGARMLASALIEEYWK